jgi:purine-nucleoside phosphorylase
MPSSVVIKKRATKSFAPSEAAAVISRKSTLRPALGIVLGSGFAAVAGQITDCQELAFTAVPGFAVPGVSGHKGAVLIGRLSGVPVLILSGRLHYYEGHPIEVVTFGVRVMAELGVRVLLLTNAAGGIAKSLREGDFSVSATISTSWG